MRDTALSSSDGTDIRVWRLVGELWEWKYFRHQPRYILVDCQRCVSHQSTVSESSFTVPSNKEKGIISSWPRSRPSCNMECFYSFMTLLRSISVRTVEGVMGVANVKLAFF